MKSNFELFTHRRHLARFISRYELFMKILKIEGSIIECGVFKGDGVLAWGKLSEIFEPYAYKRKIFGFDTFEGFPDIKNKKDKSKIYSNSSLTKKKFKLENSEYEQILKSITEFDKERYLNNYKKISLIKGDAIKTIPRFIKENKHLLVALLFIDFDIYHPAKIALKNFLPRMGRGSIIAFDEINNDAWPGETLALIEELEDLKRYKIEKFHFESNISYIVL